MDEIIKNLIPAAHQSGAASGQFENELPELDDDELKAVILKARIAKQAKINELAYIEKLRQKPVYWQPTAEEYKAELLRANPWFKIDKQSELIFNKLLLYFTNDAKFEENTLYKLHKGIMLAGPVGTGKTALLSLFRTNPRASYMEVNCAKITEDFAKDGFSVIERFAVLRESAPNRLGQTTLGLFVDDLGTDEERNNYGNKTNAVADILMRRYNNNVPYNYTHATTNLNGEQMKQIYGERLTSRIRGMFNIISFAPGSTDRRV